MNLFDTRAVLFLPASNPRAIAKARASAADLVILDLDDAVKPGDKDAAREAAVHAVEPQLVIESALSREWENWGIPRWWARYLKLDHEVKQIELRTPTREDYTLFGKWQLEPGTTLVTLSRPGAPP